MESMKTDNETSGAEIEANRVSHQEETANRLYETMLNGVGGPEAKGVLIMALRVAYSAGSNRAIEDYHHRQSN